MGEVTWIDGFLAGVVAAVALALALGTIRRVSRMEHRFELRLRAAEDRLVVAPTRDDFARMSEQLHALAISLTTATERMRGTQHSVDMVASFLMAKGSEKIEAEQAERKELGHAE